jgi:hypothetical protein
VDESKVLLKTFPRLWRKAKQKGRLPGGHIILRIHNREKLDEWREFMFATQKMPR